jgi:hypothetical protein
MKVSPGIALTGPQVHQRGGGPAGDAAVAVGGPAGDAFEQGSAERGRTSGEQGIKWFSQRKRFADTSAALAPLRRT